MHMIPTMDVTSGQLGAEEEMRERSDDAWAEEQSSAGVEALRRSVHLWVSLGSMLDHCGGEC